MAVDFGECFFNGLILFAPLYVWSLYILNCMRDKSKACQDPIQCQARIIGMHISSLLYPHCAHSMFISEKREQAGGDNVWYIFDVIYATKEGKEDENELNSNLTTSYYQCNSYIRVNKTIYDEHNVNNVIHIQYRPSKRLYPSFVTTTAKSIWRQRIEKIIWYLVILGSIFLAGYIGYDSYTKSGGIVAIIWSYLSGILYVCVSWLLKFAVDQCKCKKDPKRNELQITETDYEAFIQELEEEIDNDIESEFAKTAPLIDNNAL